MTDNDDRACNDEIELLAARLPRELAPPVEIWPRVAARLTRQSDSPLEALARRLAADVPPPAPAWAGVAAQIGRSRAGRRGAWLGAAVMLAALGGWLAVANRTPSELAGPDVRPATAAFEPREPSVPFGAAWMLGSPEVPWEVAMALQRDLTLVQNERLAIERALERAPDDGDLRELWALAYEAELELNDISGRTIMAYQRGSDI